MHGFSIMLVARGPQPEVIVKPPALVVEILSPDDTYTETQSRSADYLHMGVPCVWIIDPTSGQAASASETPGQPLKY
jgi:Uma2 family endonuclease